MSDLRKLCSIEAYTPADNVAELTARTNDEGWDTVFEQWLRVSKLKDRDLILVLSVGGGNAKENVMAVANEMRDAIGDKCKTEVPVLLGCTELNVPFSPAELLMICFTIGTLTAFVFVVSN